MPHIQYMLYILYIDMDVNIYIIWHLTKFGGTTSIVRHHEEKYYMVAQLTLSGTSEIIFYDRGPLTLVSPQSFLV